MSLPLHDLPFPPPPWFLLRLTHIHETLWTARAILTEGDGHASGEGPTIPLALADLSTRIASGDIWHSLPLDPPMRVAGPTLSQSEIQTILRGLGALPASALPSPRGPVRRI